MTSDPPPHPDDPLPPAPATSEPVRQKGSFQLPADYYDTPATSSGKPGFPRWVPLGCGGAGCLVLILMVLAGTYITKKGPGRMFDMLLAPIAATLENSMESDVTSEEKAALQRELGQFRSHVRDNEISILEVQSVIEALRKKTAGRKMSREDVRELTRLLREVNEDAAAPRRRGVEGRPAPLTGSEAVQKSRATRFAARKGHLLRCASSAMSQHRLVGASRICPLLTRKPGHPGFLHSLSG